MSAIAPATDAIDYRRVFQVCVLVTDLEAAVRSLAGATGMSFADPWTYEDLRYWTPRGGVTTSRIRVTYSHQGPQHLELIEPAPGGFFDLALRRGAHHVGVWSDAVGAEAAALVAAGWTVEAAAVSPEEGCGRVAFVRPPGGGMLMEIVSTQIRPLMQGRVGKPLDGVTA
jgi:catechol 2,3-dioxygenase-like lactoylglutathione lyase family enzyme